MPDIWPLSSGQIFFVHILQNIWTKLTPHLWIPTNNEIQGPEKELKEINESKLG